MMQHLPKFLRDQFNKHMPQVRDTFLRGMQDLRDSSDLAKVVDALERGQIDLVLDRLNIDPQYLDEVADAMRAAYIEAGRTILTGLPATVAAIRFQGRNPRAESWAAEHSSRFITEVINDQRNAVRVIISEGVALGRGPRQTALDIVGRINRGTRRREGGVIGLTSQQAGYIANARRELMSSTKTDLQKYLSRALRDRRYDTLVRQALRTGQPISRNQLEKMVVSYSNRMLKHRGDVVGRTETLTALNAGRREGIEQLVERGNVPRDKIKKIWRATGDNRTRDTHELMQDQIVEGDQPFVTPTGYRLLYPGDSSLGAPPAETIQCRCYMEYRIDYLGQIRG